MSIKGVSDKLRLPRRGKIRLGEKKLSEKSGKEHPVALDYFAVPDEIKSIYGNKPRKLDIMLPMEDRESFFPQNYKRYGSSAGLLCKGNGEIAAEAGEKGMQEVECLGKDCEWYKKGDCKQVGNFQVILPKIKGLGIYQIDTSSYNSIVNLNSGIEMIRGMLGRVSWIPLILEVQLQEAHPLVNGKKIKTTIPVMSITADLTVYDMLKMKSSLPTQQVSLDNQGIDDKPDLLFPNAGDKQSTEKEEKTKLERKKVEVKKKKDQEKARVEREQYEADMKEIKRLQAKHQTKLEAEKDESAKIEDLGETEVKDESMVLSDKETDKEQAKALDKGKKPDDEGRNQLNIKWHVLKKKMFDINYFSDDKSYREWLTLSFDGKDSSKKLDKLQLAVGIGMMAKIYNEHVEKGNKKDK